MSIIKYILTSFLIFAIPFTFFSEGSQPHTQLASAKKKKSSKSKNKLNWKKYYAICGAKNDEREKNFEKIKGRTVLWVGTLAEITKDLALTDNPRWAENVIRVKMDPSDSLVADVKLRIPKAMTDKMMSLEKGQYVAFKGKIMYLGTRLSDHLVEVENFKKVKPKVKKNPNKE